MFSEIGFLLSFSSKNKFEQIQKIAALSSFRVEVWKISNIKALNLRNAEAIYAKLQRAFSKQCTIKKT